MTICIVMLSIVLLFSLMLRARIGARIRVTPDAYEVRLRWGIFTFRTWTPQTEGKPKRTRRSRKKPKEAKKGPGEETKPAIKLAQVIDMLPAVRWALGKLGRGFRVEQLELYLIVATGDVAKTAALYGAVNAGLGLMAPITGKIKNTDIAVGLDYNLSKPQIYMTTALSIRTGAILSAGLALLLTFLRNRKRV